VAGSIGFHLIPGLILLSLFGHGVWFQTLAVPGFMHDEAFANRTFKKSRRLKKFASARSSVRHGTLA
jgi:hypothetical protein